MKMQAEKLNYNTKITCELCGSEFDLSQAPDGKCPICGNEISEETKAKLELLGVDRVETSVNEGFTEESNEAESIEENTADEKAEGIEESSESAAEDNEEAEESVGNDTEEAGGTEEEITEDTEEQDKSDDYEEETDDNENEIGEEHEDSLNSMFGGDAETSDEESETLNKDSEASNEDDEAKKVLDEKEYKSTYVKESVSDVMGVKTDDSDKIIKFEDDELNDELRQSMMNDDSDDKDKDNSDSNEVYNSLIDDLSDTDGKKKLKLNIGKINIPTNALKISILVVAVGLVLLLGFVIAKTGLFGVFNTIPKII